MKPRTEHGTFAAGSYEDREWNTADFGNAINRSSQHVKNWLEAEAYPHLAAMRTIEKVTGWKAADQIMTLPVDGTRDSAYSEGLRIAIDKWWKESA